MPAQNNTGRQYDKTHALTQVATAILAEARFEAARQRVQQADASSAEPTDKPKPAAKK